VGFCLLLTPTDLVSIAPIEARNWFIGMEARIDAGNSKLEA
jgi:hypothetical protein